MEKLIVSQIEIEEETSTVHIEGEIDPNLVSRLRAGERILVDSDDYAFIYMLEDEERYFYLRFEQVVWPALSEAYKKRSALYAKLDENTRLALVEVHNELDFLLENIDGNGNYGEAFEQAVKEAF
ncbi:hypothetical protein [Shouchella shacheensis]|uniref:UPF0738 family protein n=1 Tax=Shouchella shacheensis TaxID=1649580 RepID=UPI000740486F|nr:hypothetical protein [Shouchella shacheensis]